jgi:hypothetical protein
MKRLLILLVAFALIAGLNTGGLAQQNTMSQNTPNGPDIPCTFGSCFVPLFAFNGDTVSYSSPPAGPRIEFADCCLPGDSYVVLVTGVRATATSTFVSQAPLDNACSTGPYLDSYAVEVTGASEVKMKVLGAEGGFPAGAYIRMQGNQWTQTAGVDSCGF